MAAVVEPCDVACTAPAFKYTFEATIAVTAPAPALSGTAPLLARIVLGTIAR